MRQQRIVGNIISDAIDAVGSVGQGLIEDIESIPAFGGLVKGALGALSDFAHTAVGQIVLTALAPEAVSILWSVPLIGPVVSDVGWCLPGLARGEKLSTAAAEQVTRYAKYAGIDGASGDFASTTADALQNVSPDAAQAVQDFQDSCANLEEEARAAGKIAGEIPDDAQTVLDQMGARLGLKAPVDWQDYVYKYAQDSGIANEAAIAGALAGVLGMPLPDPATLFDEATHRFLTPPPLETQEEALAVRAADPTFHNIVSLTQKQALARSAAANTLGMSLARYNITGALNQKRTLATAQLTSALHPEASDEKVGAASTIAHDAVNGRPGAMQQLLATGDPVGATALIVKARLTNRRVWVDHYISLGKGQ